MKTKLGTPLSFVGVMLFVVGALLTRGAVTPAAQGPGGVNDADVNGGVATLFMVDPITQTLCFADGHAGHLFQQNEVRNRCSDIEYGNYNADSLTIGVEGARLGVILDLGSAADLAQAYKLQGADSAGQYFASIRIENKNNRKAVFFKDRAGEQWLELKESEQLFQEGKLAANAPVRLGHIYLVRITDTYDKTFQRMAKLMVVAHTPNQSATIRWYLL